MDHKAQIHSLRVAALKTADSRAGLRHVLSALGYAEAFLGKGIADGAFADSAMPAPRALEIVGEVRAILEGCYD